MRALQPSIELQPRPAKGLRRARQPPIVRAQQTAGSTSTEPRIGEKIRKWMQTPFDLAAFGPRATLGALISAPEKLQNLQSDLIRISELLQDPRPAQEKGEVLLEEIETRIVDFLERGATVEADILSNIKAVLPEDLANIIPDAQTLVSSTSEPTSGVMEEEPVTYTSASVAADQATAEKTGLQGALDNVKENLKALRANTTPSRQNMLKLNLRETKDQLDRLLREVSSSEVGEIVTEAKNLLAEAEAEL